MTPQPGEATQEILIDEAAKGKRYADHYLKDLRKRANEMAEEGTETVGRPPKAVASEETGHKGRVQARITNGNFLARCDRRNYEPQ